MLPAIVFFISCIIMVCLIPVVSDKIGLTSYMMACSDFMFKLSGLAYSICWITMASISYVTSFTFLG